MSENMIIYWLLVGFVLGGAATFIACVAWAFKAMDPHK